jgi:hypothetical protein
MHLKILLKYLLLLTLAALMTATTFVFGALPMRAVRSVYGRLFYWSGFAIVAIALLMANNPLYAMMLLALVILVGVFAEVEEHGGTVFVSGLAGVLSAVGTNALIGGLWLQRNKLHLIEELRTQVTSALDQMAKMNPNSVVNVDVVMRQLPSVLVISLICALAISLIGETQLLRLIGSRQTEQAAVARGRLTQFRTPDALVWVTIVALFGAFFEHGITLFDTVSVNVLNVLVLVFFCQGLAIVAHMFQTYKVSNFWQSLWYIVLVLQLFLMVSLVGFVDFWLEIRERLTRKPAATNKSF